MAAGVESQVSVGALRYSHILAPTLQTKAHANSVCL